MRLEIADTPVSPRDLAANYRAARARLLRPAAITPPEPVAPPEPEPQKTAPVTAHFEPLLLNAGISIRAQLGNFVPGVTLTRVSQAVCERFHVVFSDLRSPSRNKGLVKPRQIICYLARRHTGRSLAEIGRLLGGRDHTTVLYSVRHVEANFEQFREDIEAIQINLAVK
jgi:hypothetical protein